MARIPKPDKSEDDKIVKKEVTDEETKSVPSQKLKYRTRKPWEKYRWGNRTYTPVSNLTW